MIAVIGDSLGVGTRPYLPALVHQQVVDDSRGSRNSSQGIQVLRVQLSRHHHPRVVVFALGTNDWSLRTLRHNIRRAHALAGGACFITVSIMKPGRDLNRAFRGYRHVVPWRHYTKRHHVLGPDGVHATVVGYRARARLIAREVRQCRES